MAIVAAGEVVQGEQVLEIGPGRGFLTKELLDTGAFVTALEKDRDLIPLLADMFKDYGNFSLIEGDALAYDPPEPGYKLIANIPYYITGAILERYLSHANQPSVMVVLVQKEVAERICARGGKESILSLSVRAFGEPKLIQKISKGSFNPVPKVDSAILKVANVSRKNFKNGYHEGLYFKAIKTGFSHKRKLLASNLKEAFPEAPLGELFATCAIKAHTRAEDVSPKQWLLLSELLAEHP
jgi:16S rRNA (adenine1518-N6/adenine1519-N6)-dimethyltransferase